MVQLKGKIYFKCNTKGLNLTLGEGITPAIFDPSAGTETEGGFGICVLDADKDKAKIKALMSHNLYVRGNITRVKSGEEIEALKAQHEGQQFAFNLKSSLESGVLQLPDFSKLTKDKTMEFANQCGVSVVGEDGKELTIKQLADAIAEAIDTAEDPGDFDEDADEKERLAKAQAGEDE
jgi:hypothetical protein